MARIVVMVFQVYTYTHQVEVNKYAQFFVYLSDLNKVV